LVLQKNDEKRDGSYDEKANQSVEKKDRGTFKSFFDLKKRGERPRRRREVQVNTLKGY